VDGIKVLFVGYIRVKDNRLNFFLFYFYFIFSFYFYFYLFLDLELGISMISHMNITNCYMMCHSITHFVTNHDHMIMYHTKEYRRF